ncbi:MULTISPECIES: DEAD/DEAH box helicase [Nostoc]|uniref:Superfamily I DNA/RNA helicase n=1 Tax=Nostoc paludosum FACHB-159 TaxID=2692908 RepID=A0ABR8KLV0_9NOSO|nr:MULTISPECIES: DEAD/DEAH box helicase [Nostoc]MBD2683317.1 superfamily I DNA/RNA helicase [Nostoc sp. FACHB-857]MBD2739621.1 superfamily I DNA/RNA helicase [Nostoc paludosum FACHB-159]
MLESEKLIQIVQAWLGYIRLEELTQAEVERSSDIYSKVVDKGVQLVGNKLLLDSEVFTQFQQQQQAAKRGNKNDVQMAVAFPQIYIINGKGKEQKLKYLPLFTIDISLIFKGNYRKTGWDLTEYEFQPVVVNLMRLYGLEEEQAESLIVASGIGKFLEDTFKGRFPTLRDFLELVDLPEVKYKTSRQPYLLRCDFTPYNALLKQDIQEILKELQQPDSKAEWLNETHPAMQYLWGQLQSPRDEVMFWGAFPDHAPDEFQASVLKHTQENLLTAVCGPPGNGKTEVFLHLIAQQVVNRALRLVHGEDDANNLIFFVATNNSTVKKFQQRLTIKSPGQQFYLPGGNQTNIRKETLPKLQSTQDWLRNTEFNLDSWQQAKLYLLQAESEIQQLIEQDRLNTAQKIVDVERLEQLDVEIQSLNDDIAAKSVSLEAQTEQLSSLAAYENFPIDAYEQIQIALFQAERELPKDSDSITKRALDWLNATTDKRIFQRLANRVNAAVLNTLATAHPFQIPIDSTSLTTAITSVNQKIGFSRQWRNLNSEVTEIQNKIAALTKELELKQALHQQIQEQLDSYPQQIEPIVNMSDDTIKQYFKTAFLDRGMKNEDYYRYAPTAKYTATAYHRAAGASGTEGDNGNGIILRNHYRCTPSIIQFCSPNYPGGLQILSDNHQTATEPHLLAYHVEGSHTHNTNPEEINAVEAVITSLLKQGYFISAEDNSKTIGVMSPFLQQANALRYRLSNRWRNFCWDDIGTVHTFQGGEKAAIIFSAYQCHQEHSFWFLNRKPNLLNTAVSRAKELFILVGNVRELELAGGETKRLVEHIRQHGEIRT